MRLARMCSLLAALLPTAGCYVDIDVPPGREFGCEMLFSPDAESLAITQEGAARWGNATGCSFRVGEGGIPVTMTDNLQNNAGRSACGYTRMFYQVKPTRKIMGINFIQIDRECPTQQATMLHELAHAMAPAADHTKDGLFAESATVDFIDEVSLSAVCEHLECKAFQPESPSLTGG
jgi:hypothetical protein